MADIRFICISDLHFGAYNSLLTPTSENGTLELDQKSEVLVRLLKVLQKIISSVNKKRKAKFILNGDIFELALSNTNEAVMSFDSFLNLGFTKERKEFFSSKIIFIPGNHDHHLWETARERQFLDHVNKFEPGTFIEPPWHHTKMIKPSSLNSKLITTLMQRHKNLKDGRALTVYPNLTLVNRETDKYITISHGHFIESIYYLMSKLKSILLKSNVFPETIDEIEKENFAWIDFFWSMLGRSGDVGTSIGIMYDMLQEEEKINILSKNLLEFLLKKGYIPDAIRNIINPIIGFFITKEVSKLAFHERGLTDELLSEDSLTGLYSYINGPLKLQYLAENKNVLPKKMDFIFGHTHKPFARNYNGFESNGYPDSIGIYNTGGWVIDTIKPQTKAGGAITLIDEDNNVVLLNLFKETDLSIYFESCDPSNPLMEKLEKNLELDSKTFKSFSKTLGAEINRKRIIIRNRIE